MPDVLPGSTDQSLIQLHPQDVGGVKPQADSQCHMTGATTDIQHRLVSEPISFQEAEPRVLLCTNPPPILVTIGTVVTIEMAVVPVLVTVFVLLLLCPSCAKLRFPTPEKETTKVT